MAKILLAGEDLAILDTMQAAIEGEGHEVLTAATGLDAYETTLSDEPDLVFLEMAMPVFNGFETCEMIRQDPDVPATLPIILLTNEDQDVRKLVNVGVSEQFSKVHLTVELRDLLVKHLEDKAGPDRDA